MGLTLLATTSLPLSFWAKAFIAFVHIINVLPTEVLSGNNPYHLLFQRQPDYNKFKNFGCACYPSLRPYNKRKFSFRSSCCLFLGYSIQHAGYICLTPEGKTIISRHVIFNEFVFPCNDHTNRFEIEYASSQVSSEPLPSIIVMQSCSMSSPSLVINNDSLSPSPSPHNHSASPTLPSQTPISTNTHPMVTRAKLGIFKPRVYHTSLPSIPSHPTSVKDVIASSIWFTAMHDEYNVLLSNNTWTLTSFPPGAPFVGCKWVFKTKLNADGSFQRCKAQLVAKGFHQTEGIYYVESFSPVVWHSTIRLVLAYVVASHWPIRQIERVYMQQPPGFTSTDPHLVCHLHKAIYGLKQAPRSWFRKISTTLQQLGFHSIKSDTSLFFKFASSYTLFVLVYVNDILITRSSETAITDLITRLNSFSSLKDLGRIHHFFGIQVSCTPSGEMHLSHTQYIRDILRKTNMLTSNPQASPMISSLRLKQSSSSSEVFYDPTLYKSVIGALQYLLVTRPKLSYFVNKVSQFMHDPHVHHWQAVKRILRYLAGTLDHGIMLHPHSSSFILAFSNADWVADVDDRKSTTGYCVYLGSNLVSWSTHKQKNVSRSSTEAEYHAIAAVMTKILWLQSLLCELHIPTSTPQIYSDNLGAVLLSANPIMHSKSKHFELDLHFVRDHIQQHVKLLHICARYQVVDPFTKPI